MFLAKSNYKPKPEKPKLTERQRFERWYMRKYGLRRMPTEDHDMLAYWDMIGQWAAWLASARAKR